MRFLKIVLVVEILAYIFVAGKVTADESLVLYLPFDGDAPEDLSEYGHAVEIVGSPGHVDGKYGKAYETSTGNYIKIPINDTLQLQEKFTIEFWVLKAASQPATWNYMVAGGSLKWAVILNSDQRVYIWTSNPGWTNRLITDETLPDDWTHIAVIHDVDEGVEVYFDGELAGSGPEPAPVVETDGSIMVGARHPGSEFFAGTIDDVVLYNRALDIDEIKRDMEAIGGTAVSAQGKLASTWGKIKEL